VRPWYAAAATGPKSVVFIHDVGEGGCTTVQWSGGVFDLINSSLSIGDRFAFVGYCDGISLETGPLELQRGSEHTKWWTTHAAWGVHQWKNGNFYDRLETAFDILDNSASQDGCGGQTAIVFMTNWADMFGHSEDEIMGLIRERNKKHDAAFLTAPIGYHADEHLLRRIACENRGVFFQNGLSVSAFQQFFAAGMGGVENRGFTAWVEPYEFATGSREGTSGVKGTTVAAPVYDSSVTPPVLVGVIASDLPVSYLEEVAGSYENALEALMASSVSRCPEYHLSDCALKALRDQATRGYDKCENLTTRGFQCDQDAQCQEPEPNLRPRKCPQRIYPDGRSLLPSSSSSSSVLLSSLELCDPLAYDPHSGKCSQRI